MTVSRQADRPQTMRMRADELATPFFKPYFRARDHGESQSVFVPGLKPGLGRNWLRQWRESS